MSASPSRGMAALLDLMVRLREPEHGCSWDRAQTFSSVAPYTIEEAYEVADAIARGDLDDLRDELGDLLFNVVFHARMAEEAGRFAFDDVVDAVITKMLRRHPHLFGSDPTADPSVVAGLWQKIKDEEAAEKRARKGEAGAPREGALAAVSAGLPAFARALKLQDKAAAVGFDWPDLNPVLAKLREEIDELAEAAAAQDATAIEEELGDLLFAAVNVARHARIDPERALRGANLKFERRFRAIETGLRAQGRTLDEASLEEMEALWVAAKQAEKTR